MLGNMNTLATRPAKYDDLFDLPENIVGEIIAGELVTHPRPSPKHALVVPSKPLEFSRAIVCTPRPKIATKLRILNN